MKNFIFYSIAGSIVWWISQSLGMSFGVSMFASLVLPPLMIIALLIYKSR